MIIWKEERAGFGKRERERKMLMHKSNDDHDAWIALLIFLNNLLLDFNKHIVAVAVHRKSMFLVAPIDKSCSANCSFWIQEHGA